MKRFERNGTIFTAFEHAGETYLCTGNPTGKFEFAWAGEFNDYYTCGWCHKCNIWKLRHR